jgi:hypothetical protein
LGNSVNLSGASVKNEVLVNAAAGGKADHKSGSL